MGPVALQSEPSEAEGSHAAGSGTRQAQAEQGAGGTVPPGLWRHTLYFCLVAKICPFGLAFANSIYSTMFS